MMRIRIKRLPQRGGRWATRAAATAVRGMGTEIANERTSGGSMHMTFSTRKEGPLPPGTTRATARALLKIVIEETNAITVGPTCGRTIGRRMAVAVAGRQRGSETDGTTMDGIVAATTRVAVATVTAEDPGKEEGHGQKRDQREAMAGRNGTKEAKAAKEARMVGGIKARREAREAKQAKEARKEGTREEGR